MPKGKVVSRKKLSLPIGEVEIIETQYPQFRHRKRTIFWLGEGQARKLGELVTTYHVPSRKSDFEPVVYKPLCYKVVLTADAEVGEITGQFFTDEDVVEGLKEGFEFEEEEDANKFIRGLKCKGLTYGGVELDREVVYLKWAKVLERAKKQEGEEL